MTPGHPGESAGPPSHDAPRPDRPAARRRPGCPCCLGDPDGQPGDGTHPGGAAGPRPAVLNSRVHPPSPRYAGHLAAGPTETGSSVERLNMPGLEPQPNNAVTDFRATRWVALNLMNVRRCPTLPHPPECSTIGAGGLSFRVRNVTGRFPSAMTAVTLSTCQTPTPTMLGMFVCRELHSGRVAAL